MIYNIAGVWKALVCSRETFIEPHSLLPDMPELAQTQTSATQTDAQVSHLKATPEGHSAVAGHPAVDGDLSVSDGSKGKEVAGVWGTSVRDSVTKLAEELIKMVAGGSGNVLVEEGRKA